MTSITKRIVNDILLLPREERAELIDKLIESLNLPTQKVIDRLWQEEVEKRLKEYQEGKIKAVDGEQVFREIRNRLVK